MARHTANGFVVMVSAWDGESCHSNRLQCPPYAFRSRFVFLKQLLTCDQQMVVSLALWVALEQYGP